MTFASNALIVRARCVQMDIGFVVEMLMCAFQHYTPGPGETLQNFEVHLKNRQHRAKVNARLHPPMES